MNGTAPATIAFYDAYATLDGAGTMLRLLIRHLDRERFRPVLVLPREGELAGMARTEGCPVYVLPPGPPLDRYGGELMSSGALGKVRAAQAVRRYSREVARLLREVGAGLLHCNQTRAVLQAGMSGVYAGVPVVWNVRIRERLPALLVRYAAGVADRVIALTSSIMDDFPGAERLREITIVIPNAVDTDRFSPAVDGAAARAELGLGPDDPLVLTVGLLGPRKGHDLLLRATPGILGRFPSARVAVVGRLATGVDASWPRHLRAMADDLGVSGAIDWLGWRDDVPELLAACDVFVLASRQEGFPAAVLEAMAVGRPVVVTPAASAGVHDRACGRIVPAENSAALAEAVVDLLAHRPAAREMGREARRRVVEQFGLEAMIRRYEQVYAELLGRR